MRVVQRCLWPFALFAACSQVCLALAATPVPVPEGVTISFSIPDSVVSLHEPVYLQLSVRNELSESVHFDLGPQGKQTFEFAVIAPNGSVVRTAPPELGAYVMGRPDDRPTLAPGDTFAKTMVLNEWYPFPAPGSYVVRAKLTAPVLTESGATLELPPPQEIPLQVKPRDPERLRVVCEELSKKVLGGHAEEAKNAAFALSYVDDPIAVPYLGRVLKHGFFGLDHAIAGLVRIGTSEAVQALTSSLDTQNEELKLLIQNALSEIRAKHPEG